MNNFKRKSLQNRTLQHLLINDACMGFHEIYREKSATAERLNNSHTMLETTRIVLLLTLLLGLSIIPIPANALIIQETTVLYAPTAPVGFSGGPSDIDIDRTTNSSGPIDRVTYAHVSGAAYEVASSIDQFGNLGVSGFIRGDSGTISGEVEATSNEFINTEPDNITPKLS